MGIQRSTKAICHRCRNSSRSDFGPISVNRSAGSHELSACHTSMEVITDQPFHLSHFRLPVLPSVACFGCNHRLGADQILFNTTRSSDHRGRSRSSVDQHQVATARRAQTRLNRCALLEDPRSTTRSSVTPMPPLPALHEHAPENVGVCCLRYPLPADNERR